MHLLMHRDWIGSIQILDSTPELMAVTEAIGGYNNYRARLPKSFRLLRLFIMDQFRSEKTARINDKGHLCCLVDFFFFKCIDFFFPPLSFVEQKPKYELVFCGYS